MQRYEEKLPIQLDNKKNRKNVSPPSPQACKHTAHLVQDKATSSGYRPSDAASTCDGCFTFVWSLVGVFDSGFGGSGGAALCQLGMDGAGRFGSGANWSLKYGIAWRYNQSKSYSCVDHSTSRHDSQFSHPKNSERKAYVAGTCFTVNHQASTIPVRQLGSSFPEFRTHSPTKKHGFYLSKLPFYALNVLWYRAWGGILKKSTVL